MSFFQTSDGKQIQQNEEYDSGSGFEDIPNNTHALAAITEVKWQSFEGSPDHISISWTILKPEAYKGRKVFQKCYVNGKGDEKDDAGLNKTKDKAKNMFVAIDTNAGGHLVKAGKEPTDESMGVALANKMMGIRIMRYNITKDRTTGEDLETPITGNYIGAVCSKEKIVVTQVEEKPATQATPRPTPRPAPRPAGTAQAPAQRRPAAQQQPAPEPEPQPASDFDQFDDDIPF